MVETVMIGNVYPRYGDNISEVATPDTPSNTEAVATQKSTSELVPNDNPLATLLVFLGMLLLLMFVTAKWGNTGEYANIRASAYNVFIIGLAAATFIPILKLAAVKVPGPWTSYVLSI